MNQAFKIIHNGGSLIAIHKGRYFKKADGLSLGPGPFVAALEYATDQECVLIGKPAASFFYTALKSVGLSPNDANMTVMIGDDVRDDVGGAMQCGMRGYLVKTGKYVSGDELNKGVNPTMVFNNLADAIDHILTMN